MYSDDKMVLELISLLKQFGVRRIVVSPGSRHYPFVHSLEFDDFFKLYSVVDERSAAFFALGLIQQTKESVAVTCSSGTACMNYGSAIVEAYYQHLPLLVLSSDRLPQFLNQQEDQMYNQIDTFTQCTKYQGQLVPVKNNLDAWYCNRIINEGLNELSHHGKGPVHLNIPFLSHSSDTFSSPTVPVARKISFNDSEISLNNWNVFAEKLKNKKVMILWGQSVDISEDLMNEVSSFCKKFGAVVLTDKLSNFHSSFAVENTPTTLVAINPLMDKAMPDYVITVGGNYVFNPEITGLLRKSNVQHWRVGKEGKVIDPFHKLTEIFEMSEIFFFKNMLNNSISNGKEYFDLWKKSSAQQSLPELNKYSELYAIGKLMMGLPNNCDLQLANSNTIRMAHFFPTDSTIRVNCNRGVNGIDGSMSTMVGYAAENERLTFYITGDLSFFYDMNALWNKHLSVNIRILLINNHGGAIMYTPGVHEVRNDFAVNIAAGNPVTARGWAESVGFKYLSASNSEEYDIALKTLLAENIKQPVLLEAFTNLKEDVIARTDYIKSLDTRTFTDKVVGKIKRKVSNILK